MSNWHRSISTHSVFCCGSMSFDCSPIASYCHNQSFPLDFTLFTQQISRLRSLNLFKFRRKKYFWIFADFFTVEQRTRLFLIWGNLWIGGENLEKHRKAEREESARGELCESRESRNGICNYSCPFGLPQEILGGNLKNNSSNLSNSHFEIFLWKFPFY